MHIQITMSETNNRVGGGSIGGTDFKRPWKNERTNFDLFGEMAVEEQEVHPYNWSSKYFYPSLSVTQCFLQEEVSTAPLV